MGLIRWTDSGKRMKEKRCGSDWIFELGSELGIGGGGLPR